MFKPDYDAHHSADGVTITIKPHLISGLPPQQLDLTPAQFTGFLKWRRGGLIQDCLPDLTSSQRELLMTGMTEAMWAKTFGEDER